uniref:Uncharacterized protein n=1 Tax=Rhizophora mucronata TaxID=61149 RepID=A0A2P2QCG7_RHIMU
MVEKLQKAIVIYMASRCRCEGRRGSGMVSCIYVFV